MEGMVGDEQSMWNQADRGSSIPPTANGVVVYASYHRFFDDQSSPLTQTTDAIHFILCACMQTEVRGRARCCSMRPGPVLIFS
jgi:hypothetical protein